jgi:cobalt/nickel transport system permease protein
MDRAGNVYESMMLRGFKGDFNVQKRSPKAFDHIYTLAWIAAFIVIRFIV